MTTFRCPTGPDPHAPTDLAVEHHVIGCGRVFDAEPDDEGLVDCDCGMWFNPRAEPETVVHPPDCYPCQGTGTVQGFGVAPGAPCPADHLTEG